MHLIPEPLLKPYLLLIAACSDGQLRLIGGYDGQTQSGRLEICSQQIWETFTADYWEYYSAMVACNELGFNNLGKYICTCVLQA